MIFFPSCIYFYTKTNSKFQMVMKDVCGHEFSSARPHLLTECSELLIHLTRILKNTFPPHTHTQATIDAYTLLPPQAGRYLWGAARLVGGGRGLIRHWHY